MVAGFGVDPLSQPNMQINRANPKLGIGKWLTLSVHFDAFRAAPRAYLTALWWRLRRKRLRARGQLAPLLAQARRAYDLWQLEKNTSIPLNDAFCVATPIVALIDVGPGQGELDRTLSSLSSEGVAVLLIGSQDIPTLAEAALWINWSKDPWLLPIGVGDTLASGAGAVYRDAIAGTDVSVIYADDDLLDNRGRRTAPHFKPDWNAELFRHFDYLSGACIFRASREEVEALNGAPDWAQQLVVRMIAERAPLHLRQILHHRQRRPSPRVPLALELPSGDLPLVSVIIPTRNRVDLLRTCLKGIDATDYPQIEVIVVDNDSDDPETLGFLADLDPTRHRILRHEGTFNYSAINNRAVMEARGKLLCLLNNDIEVVEQGWLKAMVSQALRDEVGAVGARLLYPDGRIQHAGVVIGMGNAAGHAHRFIRPNEEGYFYRHALPQFASAVTAACLVVRRDRFLAVGGLDERNFAVAFNDVDLCLRLNQQGWQTLYEPRATLTHHESVSRGLDRDPVGAARFAGELAALQRLWGTHELVDPFHHPELSRASERFVLRLRAGP